MFGFRDGKNKKTKKTIGEIKNGKTKFLRKIKNGKKAFTSMA